MWNLIASNLPSYSEISGPVFENFRFADADLGAIVSQLTILIFALAGVTLFGFIIISGFKMLTSGGNPDKLASAQKTLTNAFVGFLIVISAYWLTQVAEIIFDTEITTGEAPGPAPSYSPPPVPTITCRYSCVSPNVCRISGELYNNGDGCETASLVCCNLNPLCADHSSASTICACSEFETCTDPVARDCPGHCCCTRICTSIASGCACCSQGDACFGVPVLNTNCGFHATCYCPTDPGDPS